MKGRAGLGGRRGWAWWVFLSYLKTDESRKVKIKQSNDMIRNHRAWRPVHAYKIELNFKNAH